jgi:hypothetical protein
MRSFPRTDATSAEKHVTVPVRNWRVWCGLLLAPGAWALFEGAGYYIGARSCDASGGIHALGAAHPRAVLIGLAVVMAMIATTGLILAIGVARHATSAVGQHRVDFLANAGVIASAIFLGGIFAFGAPMLMLHVCVQSIW